MAKKTSFGRWLAGTTLSVLGLWSATALAAAPPPPVPATLTQQGRILDKDGAPVSSKVAITFTIYDDPTATDAADALWTETQNITLDDGYFSAQLGSGKDTPLPAGLFDGSVRYLGVTVGSDDEMTPRQPVTSVPYAMNAGTVPFAGLTGFPALCGDNELLKGFNADGTAQCATVPDLACVVRYSATATSALTAAVACNAGEHMTGGGCYAAAALTASYDDVCVTSSLVSTDSKTAPGSVSPAAIGTIRPPVITKPPVIGIPPIAIGCLLHTDQWTCNTVSATTIRAYAHCCAIQ